MLPDIRFAIGAVLASCAVLVATAFGLAVTVRVAYQKAAGPLEASRVLAYTDAGGWPHRSTHGGTGERTAASDALLGQRTAIPPDPATVGSVSRAREPATDRAWLKTPPPVETPPVPPSPQAAEPLVPPQVESTAAVSITTPNLPADEVADALPAQPERDAGARIAALPVLADEATQVAPAAATAEAADPAAPAKQDAGKPKNRKIAKKRKRVRVTVRPPTASTGYPVRGGPSVNDLFGN
jgi:hypothetical protein